MIQRFGKYLRYLVSPISPERGARQGIGDALFSQSASSGKLHSSIRRRAGTRGLALVEVLVTITIVVMIGALSFATMGNRGPSLARAEAAEIALILQRARMEAAELGRAVEIHWDAREQTLTAGSASHVLRRGTTGPSEPLTIILQPTGQSDGLTLPVTANGFAVDVTLDWLTGQVRQSS